MPDQFQNPYIKLPDQGSVSVIPPESDPVSVNPASVAETPASATPPTTGVGAGGQIEPVALPKVMDSTDTDGKLPAAEVKTVERTNIKAAEAVVEPVNPLFEVPKIFPPKAASSTAEKSTGDNSHRNKILKVTIAGVAVFFVLVSSVVAGLNLARRQGVGEIRKLAGTGVTPTLAAAPTIFLTLTLTPTPTMISADCVSLVAQMSDGSGSWTTKTDIEFAALARPGVKVRFICTRANPNGNFTKLAFFINNVFYVDEVVKLNETQFAVEYVIGASRALKVESVLLQDNKGRVD